MEPDDEEVKLHNVSLLHGLITVLLQDFIDGIGTSQYEKERKRKKGREGSADSITNKEVTSVFPWIFRFKAFFL